MEAAQQDGTAQAKRWQPKAGHQPLFLVEIAVWAALAGSVVGDVIEPKPRKSRRSVELQRVPSLRDWLRMYRTHRLCREWPRSPSGHEEDPKDVAGRQVREAATNGKSIDLPPPLVEWAASKCAEVRFPPDDATVRRIVSELTPKKTGRDDVAELKREPEAPREAFWWTVWLPCFFVHRVQPGTLLRRARQGDDASFDALLRLDKSVLADPMLARRWHEIMLGEKPKRRNRFLDAMVGLPMQRPTAKSIRIAMAGLVSQITKCIGLELTAADIGRVFDAVERVRKGNLVDERLPSGEALAKSIQRNRNWRIQGLLRIPRQVMPRQ